MASSKKKTPKAAKKRKERKDSTEEDSRKIAKKPSPPAEAKKTTKAKKSEDREVPQAEAFDTLDAPELLQRNKTLSKHNEQLAAQLMKERKEKGDQKINAPYKKRCDRMDPHHSKLKVLADSLYLTDKFLGKGDRNLVPDDPECLGMQFKLMCDKDVPLDTSDMSAELKWYNMYFPRLKYLLQQLTHKGTVKLASELQGKSKGVTLLCTTSNHLISTELKSTDKLATILSPTDIDEMVDLYLGDGGIDDVVQFLQDTSKAATTTSGTKMDKYITFVVIAASSYRNNFM